MEQALALAEARHGGALVAGSSTIVVTEREAPFVTLDTSMGKVVIELYWKHAPKTCQNFASLAARGYYSNTKFHRIIPGFMIQGGDPTATGKGGDSIYGAKFEDECHRELKHTGAGVLSMANAGPDSNGSQFFITLGPTPHLDGKHTIFARIASGMQVVKRLGQVVTDSNDRPKDEVKIYKSGVTTTLKQ